MKGAASPRLTTVLAVVTAAVLVACSTEPGSASPAMTTSPATTSVATTASLPTDLAGVVYGFIKGVDVGASELTLDKVDWFTGDAAAQACDEDGVPKDGRVNQWCSMYYFRNVNPALRVVTVSPQVAVTTLEGNSNVEVAGDLAALADRVTTPTGSSRPYRMTVTDGVVTDVTELYQP